MMPTLMALSHSRDDPASRFRIMQYLPHFKAAGWDVSHRPNVPSRYRRPALPLRPLRSLERRTLTGLRRWNRSRDIRTAVHHDVIFLNRDLQEGVLAWERRLFAANPRVVFDFDDAIYLGDERRAHVGWVCRHAAWVTPGNESLAAFARQFTDRVTVIPSTVSTERYEPHPLCGGPGGCDARRVRVGWLGSDLSIRETLFPYWGMFGRLQAQLGFEFVVCTRPRPTPPPGPLVWRFVEWCPPVEERIGRHFDIGIMPLCDTDFQRGKCGMKLLQYMAASMPVVGSAVGVNTSLVDHGRNGFLAATEQAWHDALAALIASPELRRAQGLAGRLRCESDFSARAWASRLLEIFACVASAA